MPRPRAPDLRLAGALVLAAALAGAAPGRARAHDPAAGPSLQVVADPPQLVLGRDAGADLRIAVPEDAQDVAVSASAGRVEDVRRSPPGGYSARFLAPAGRVPQVAIVAAIARTPRGIVDGWVAIPCSGQADARVRAAPGAEIALDIAGRRFGPRTAGSDGVAVIPIVVPPGVREAHHGFKPIDLKVPDTPLLHGALERATALADRTERVRVFTWVVAPHGAARRGDAPTYEASRGSVASTERQPGESEAIWTLPPGRAGEERLVVRLPTSPVSRIVLRLETVPGPAAVVAVSFDRDGVVAGAEEGVGLAVRALDTAGNPVRAALAVEAEGAALQDVREPEPGLLLGRLRAPASLGGRTEAVIRASVPGAGVSGTRTLPLLAGPPARAYLTPASAPVRSRQEAVLVLRVADAGGNPVSPEPRVAADRGKVIAVARSGPGTWRVRWTAPDVEAPSLARLVAEAGGVRATAEPVLLPPRPRASVAFAGGGARDLRGSSWVAEAGAALDVAAGPSRVLPLGLEVAWRAEVRALDVASHLGMALLGGGSASRVLSPTLVVRTTASVGAWVTGAAAAPAGRLGIDLGIERRGIAPFVETALLGATGGTDGAFAALTVSAGIRLGVERP
ncbi:MAG TPA: hypothetical protein VFL83_08465 [Anaeromyxobacter sp.]|nr:hypothetical protein [Anaeromyxobacter sp.]